MAEWFSSGRIVDAILVGVVLEAILLIALRRRRGPAPLPLLCNLASGAALMLALRAALVGAGWPMIAVCMLISLSAHLGDLLPRLRNGRTLTLGRTEASNVAGTSVTAPAFHPRSGR